MRSKSWLQRWFSRSAAAQPTLGASRIDVKPPSLWGEAEPVWTALWGKLMSGERTPRSLQTLERARADFNAALTGLQSADAADLQRRAGHARSLRELWHLRAELYSIVARRLNQSEANRRLEAINAHFPCSASRLGTPSTLRSDEQPLA